MDFIDFLSVFTWYAVVAVITGIILLMALRLLITYADMNPFSRTAISIKRWSDPLVVPVRLSLARMGFDAKFAPLITILITILLGWLALQFVGAVLATARGVVLSLRVGSIIALIGYLLYGLLAVYSLLIFMRIILSWGASYTNRLMRFLVQVTEPLLGPFRRIVPTVGMFDISPMVALLVIRLFQEAIAGTLIR